jgi:hypothetical protein
VRSSGACVCSSRWAPSCSPSPPPAPIRLRTPPECLRPSRSRPSCRALQGEPDVATPTFVVADDRAIETRKPGDAALAGPVDRLTVANEIVVQTDDNTAAWAWVIATVDATPVKTPKARPAPYRAMVVYAKLDATWQLVTANFSVVTTKR